MKLIKISGTLGLAAFAGLVSQCALAADSGWYLGGNIGQARAKIDDERIIGGLLGAGFTTTSIEDDKHDLGYKVFGGYQFGKYFALEGGYFDLGQFGFNANVQPPGTLSGNIKLRGINFDTVGIIPFTQNFSAFARIGVNYAEAKDHFAGTGSVVVSNPDRKKRSTNYKYGVGLEYDFIKSLGMRVEVERYNIDDAVYNRGDVDLASVGLVYRFGAEVEEPAPVARAITPEPEPAVATVQPQPSPAQRVPSKVTFSADSLFAFDKAVVSPAGKQGLDTLVADLRGASFDVIVVTGHTDRIGAHAYNLALSARRAEAVKSYLVEAAGVPASKVTARGVDGSDPVTKPGECKGNKATRQLIACLQPDRRVEVEVSGRK